MNLIQTTAGIEKRVTALEAGMDQKADREDVKQLEEKVNQREESVAEKFTKLEGGKSELIEKKTEEKICEKKIGSTSLQHLYKKLSKKSKNKRRGNKTLCFSTCQKVILKIQKQEENMTLK